MANGISRDTYLGMDVDSKLNVLFDYAQKQHDKSCATSDQLEALSDRFEKRKRVDTAVSGASGFIGGALMVFVKWIIGK
jgi:hypothetical protein